MEGNGKQNFMPDPMATPIGGGAPSPAGSNTAPFLPYHDLRQWLEEAQKLGEVKEVGGLSYQQRHRHGGRNVGARRRRAVLRVQGRARHAAGQPPPGQFLRRQAQGHDARLFHRTVQARTERELPRQSRRHAQAHSAEIRRDRPGDAERDDRRSNRRDQIPGAAMASAGRRPLYRHRLLQHHARSRRRLDQLRHLPGHDPRRKNARLLHLARQARPGDARQICRARRAHAGRHRLRRRSDELPHGLERSAARRVRT